MYDKFKIHLIRLYMNEIKAAQFSAPEFRLLYTAQQACLALLQKVTFHRIMFPFHHISIFHLFLFLYFFFHYKYSNG